MAAKVKTFLPRQMSLLHGKAAYTLCKCRCLCGCVVVLTIMMMMMMMMGRQSLCLHALDPNTKQRGGGAVEGGSWNSATCTRRDTKRATMRERWRQRRRQRHRQRQRGWRRGEGCLCGNWVNTPQKWRLPCHDGVQRINQAEASKSGKWQVKAQAERRAEQGGREGFCYINHKDKSSNWSTK